MYLIQVHDKDIYNTTPSHLPWGCVIGGLLSLITLLYIVTVYMYTCTSQVSLADSVTRHE